VLAALAVGGLATDRFLFAGFLPPKSAARRAALQPLISIRATLVFYETGPRLAECLTDLLAVLGDRPAAVARELTKLHETVVRDRLSGLCARFGGEPPRGEIVILVGAGEEEDLSEDAVDAALSEALKTRGPSEAAGEVARSLGLNRKALFRRALELKSGD
jgi:16S rRNA (cytidine1402-2'-O)-methyltransferase